MVLEHAVITIRPGTAEAFEAAVAEARPCITNSSGCRSFQLHRGIESPDEYLLLVGWDTVDDHLVGFRGSEAFGQWRALIGPYFESPPVGSHLEPVESLA